MPGGTHWLPGSNSPLNTTWFNAARSIDNSSAWRTRASCPSGFFALRAVVQVDRDAGIGEAGDLGEFEAGVLLHGIDIGRRDALDQVEPARLQIGEPHRRVEIGRNTIRSNMDRILVPVIREAVEHDAVLRHPLDEFVGAGADRMGRELTVACAAFGDTIMPARSLSAASSGAKGATGRT